MQIVLALLSQVLRYSFLRFVPPSQYNRGEWNLFVMLTSRDAPLQSARSVDQYQRLIKQIGYEPLSDPHYSVSFKAATNDYHHY